MNNIRSIAQEHLFENLQGFAVCDTLPAEIRSKKGVREMEKAKIDAVAYHEAGHAFVAVMTKKIRVKKVFYDGAEGYTETEWLSGNINFEKLCFFLAGEIAEYRLSENFSEINSGIDRKNTEDVLFLISGKREEQYAFWLKAIKTVNEWIDDPKNAEKIKKIAEELMLKATLPEEDIRTIMNR